MKNLIDQILKYHNLNNQEIELVEKKCEKKKLEKGDYFSEAGKVADKLGFLSDGVIRVCYYNNKGEDITRYFVTENRFVVDYTSFRFQTVSSEYFEALTDCVVYYFSRSDFILLSKTIPSWDQIFSDIITVYMTQKISVSRELITLDAKAKYIFFLKNYPGLANKVPLSAVASFLGITQSSLSRIRKNS